jgi:hypothetical protein
MRSDPLGLDPLTLAAPLRLHKLSLFFRTLRVFGTLSAKDPTPIFYFSVSPEGTHLVPDDGGRKAETRSGKFFCKPFGMSDMYRSAERASH